MWTRLLLFLAISSLGHGFTNEDAFVVLKTDLQTAHPLDFYVHHEPESAPEKPETVVEFKPLSLGITAHLTDLGYLPGRRMISIRFLSDEKLKHGNDGAVGLMVLCSTPSDQTLFVPVIATGELDIGTIYDASASNVKELGKTRRIIWVSIHYSGTGGFVDRIALTADDVDKPLRAHSIFAKTDPLADIKKQGWELWTSGNGFNEETLSAYHHLYWDPAKGPAQGNHWFMSVPYEFRDDQLHPGKPVDEGHP
ncbi:MAG: hypothetical protein U1F71_09130 [Verrucomicrobiaceae bacterium]